MKVKSFKLSTGEEIIARVERRVIENDTIVVSHPRAIMLVGDPSRGQMGMTLVPWMASNQDGEVVLSGAHVVAETDPASDLEKGYLENTSGLQLLKG